MAHSRWRRGEMERRCGRFCYLQNRSPAHSQGRFAIHRAMVHLGRRWACCQDERRGKLYEHYRLSLEKGMGKDRSWSPAPRPLRLVAAHGGPGDRRHAGTASQISRGRPSRVSRSEQARLPERGSRRHLCSLQGRTVWRRRYRAHLK